MERDLLSGEHTEDCEEARQGEAANEGKFEDQGESVEDVTHGLKDLADLPRDGNGRPKMFKEAHMSRTPIKGIQKAEDVACPVLQGVQERFHAGLGEVPEGLPEEAEEVQEKAEDAGEHTLTGSVRVRGVYRGACPGGGFILLMTAGALIDGVALLN